ncbi:MAG: DUF4101 domain-containing protein [Microcystis aeruginosa Ma_MB_F_20061100_S20]|uniref:DUF4101 domain-containing protein n=1 Tax=Microcystis aeruginosa Ma_MB_F_20061100_S20D TaxID=2486253 RepID=A0A552EFN3_MICAE|nr:MAG: DUF4101 domain-containing protein [Microcystis aeruginosa Ma_MB_F_20061100_S20]TRU33275.1 MAG: DUF4101 domain-containing protein [Microcystis aeruginosa Ma_MB_F_20061100_S20D]
MSYENNNGGGCLGLAIILGILLTIIYYAIQLAFIVMAGCALVASAAGIYVGLKNFYKVIKAGYQETKTRDYLDKEKSLKFVEPQKAKLMYIYGAAWYVMRYISKEVWEPTKEDAQKWLDWGKDKWSQGRYHLGGFWGFIKATVGFYGPGLGLMIGWLFHFVAASVIVALFLGIQFIFCVIGTIITSFLMLFLTVGNYLYSSFYKTYYRCPECHEPMKIPTYICPDCSTEHTRLWPSVYGVFNHTCKGDLHNNAGVCSKSLPTLTYLGRDKLLTKVCPNPECKHPLDGIGGINAHIPVVGLPNSGKSHYMFMAIKQFTEEYSPAHSLDVSIPNSLHARKYEDNINSLKNGQRLLKTSAAGDSAKGLNLEVKKTNQAVPNLLYFYDLAGEYIDTDEQAELQKYFKYVDGAFFVIDPFSINQVRQRYQDALSNNADIQDLPNQDLDAAYERMLFLFEKNKKKRKGKKFTQPVAIIVTKVDCADLEQQIGVYRAREYMASHSDITNEQDAMNILIKNFLEDNGAGNLVRNIELNFSNVRFFSCSNIGFRDQTIGSSNSSNSFDGVRVLEPMVWLMEQTNTLPHKASFIWQFLRSTTWINYGLPVFIATIMAGVLFGGYSIIRWTVKTLQPSNSSQSSEIKKSNPQSQISDKTLTEEKLKNMTYTLYNTAYPLTDGKFFQQSPNSATGQSVEIEQIYFGDINNDSSEDGVVILAENGGGSGIFKSFLVILNQNNIPTQTSNFYLGDRTIIENVEIKNNQIKLTLITHGPGDAACCPSLKVTKTFKLQGNKLSEVVPNDLLQKTSVVEAQSFSQSSSSTATLSQQDAVNLINKWLQAKRTMFAPPYDRQIAQKITTGEQYQKTAGYNGSIDYLQKKNSQYKYGQQTIDNVEKFVINGNQASIQVSVTEQQTLYINDRVDPQNTKTGTITVLYNLKLVDGSWKIESSQVIR